MRVSLPTYGLAGTKKKFKPHRKYRPLAIKYTGETETDKPIKCTISSEEIPFHLLRPDGKDVVFLDENGNILPYWIETKNSTLMQVWLKFPKASKSFLPVSVYYNNLQNVKLSHISAAFKYRRKITITEQSGKDLTDYQICIELSSSNFDFSHTKSDGSDIRFTDENGSELDYWIESWDSENEQAKVWIKIPSLPANSEKEIWMYYGNPDVNSGANGEATFLFFDDFENYGYNGAWIWFQEPRAIHFQGEKDKTYIGYCDSNFNIKVLEINHETGEVYESLLHEYNGAGDDHNNPAILVRNEDHKILAVYCKHNGDYMYYRISKNSEDVSEWEEEKSFGSNKMSYPILVQLPAENNKIYLFYRRGTASCDREYYRTSTDGGNTWSSESLLFDFCPDEWCYVKAVASEDKIHFTLSNHPEAGGTHRIYYCYYYNGKYYKADGTPIGDPPFTQSDLDVVYDSEAPGNHKAWIWDIALAEDGTPVIVFAVFPSTDNHQYYYARWNGSEWEYHYITDAGGGLYADQPYYSGGIYLDHDDPSVVYLSKEVNGQFEIQKWKTIDGGATWTKIADITSNSSEKNIRPVVPRNHHPDLPVVWMRGRYTTKTDYDTYIVSNTSVLPFKRLQDYWEDVGNPTKTLVYDESNRVLEINSGSSHDNIIINKEGNFSDFVLETRMKLPALTSDCQVDIEPRFTDVNNRYLLNFNPDRSYIYLRRYEGGSSYIDKEFSFTYEIKYYRVKIVMNGEHIDVWMDDDHVISYDDSGTGILSGKIGLGGYKASPPPRCDWVLVRKYTDPEPQINVGEEKEI